MAKHEYGARKQAILAIIKAQPGISSTDVRAAYDAQTGKASGKSTVSSSLTELHGAGDVRREKVLSDTCGYFYRYWLTELVCGFPVEAAAPVQACTPVHMKPFNIEHARAGAPYGCRDGQEATVLKFDARNSDYPLVGIRRDDDVSETWRANGNAMGDDPTENDLVMLPLGFIDGKPVFVGDELVLKPEHADVFGAENTTALPGWYPNWTPEIFAWPAPAPVYPETRLTGSELGAVYMTYDVEPTVHVKLTNVANAALRHAIDAGQVVLADGDGMERELVRAQQACAETRKMLARDAARDLAIALAVQNACVSRCKPIAGRAQLMRALGDIDLSAIIAGVGK